MTEKRKRTAVDAPRGNLFLMLPGDLTLVIDESHRLYDERVHWPVDPTRVKNVMKFGIRDNVVACKEGDKILVVNGRQRVKWALAANKILESEGKELIRVPVTLSRDDETTQTGLMISLNEIRSPDELFSKIDKLQRYLGQGRSDLEAATTFGVTTATIKNWLRLTETSAAVKKAVRDGRIPPTAAYKLAGLSVEKQKAALEKMLDGKGKPTVAKAKAARAEKDERPSLRRLVEMSAMKTLPETVIDVLEFVTGAMSERKLKKKYPEWFAEAKSDERSEASAGPAPGEHPENGQGDLRYSDVPVSVNGNLVAAEPVGGK